MTRDEHEQTALMGGSAFQETGMTDYLTHVAEVPQTDQPTAPGAIIKQFGYQPLFNAISAATEWMEGRTIGVSVLNFEASLLAAAPEAPAQIAPIGTPQNPICIDSEEMASLAEFAGISVDNREDAVGILLWVGEHRDDDGTVGYGLCASLEDYPEEGCYPLVELQRMRPDTISAAARDVLAERQRQISVEGWTPEHDDKHDALGELAHAASCYAKGAYLPEQVKAIACPIFWPWDHSWRKPSTPRRDLVKAGALILAEIERLDRAAIASTKGGA